MFVMLYVGPTALNTPHMGRRNAVNMVKIKVGRLSEFNSSPCFFIIIIEKAPSDIAKRCLNSHNPCTHAQVLPTLPVVTVRSRHA